MSKKTYFERSIFFSWSCTISDCAFCHMSTQGKQDKLKLRSKHSIIAEALLCNAYGWKLGFLTGGIGQYPHAHLLDIVKKIYQATGDKCWVSLGPQTRKHLENLKPYIAGVVGSIETINPELHKKICPSKPLPPYEKMFEHAKDLGIPAGMTFITGMGETTEDFTLLKNFIERHSLQKIWVYGVNPHEGTIFEHAQPISVEEHAWWIRELRKKFPGITIQAGVWKNRVDRIPALLAAGADGISKFPITSAFGSEEAHTFTQLVEEEGYELTSNLTHFQNINWEEKLKEIDFEEEFKQKILKTIHSYETQMKGTMKEKSLLSITR